MKTNILRGSRLFSTVNKIIKALCKSIVVMFLFKNIANVYQNVFTDTEEGVD